MNKRKVIIGVLMATIFIMVAFAPIANTIQTDKGNTAIMQQNTFNSFNRTNTTHFLKNNTGIAIETMELQHGFVISTFINGSLSSWVIYQNNIRSGRVSIMAFSDGTFSYYSHYVNESNMKGIVNTSNMTNHTSASLAATYTPGDAKYSIGIYGWAASFSSRELAMLSVAISSGATIAGVIAFFATGTIIGIPAGAIAAVAAVIMGVGSAVLGTLSITCGNGGYIGTPYFGSPVVGCNPVPWGY